MRSLRRFHLSVVLACFTAAGCSGTVSLAPHGGPSSAPNPQATRCPAANYTCIKHVVIIIQENRSFNNLFNGYPGALTRPAGYAGTQLVPLRPRGFEQSVADISHCFDSAMASWDNGKMDGFDLEYPEKWPLTNCPSLARPAVGTQGLDSPYVYVPNDAPNYVNEAGPYWQMAMQYVLADHYFPTDFGPSFTAHQYLVAGTTDVAPDLSIVNYPGILNSSGGVDVTSSSSWSCDSPAFARTSLLDAQRTVMSGAGPFPCFTQYRTIADSLDARGVSWQYYTPTTSNFPNGDNIWSPFSAIRAVRFGPDWSNIVSPQTKVLDVVAKGQLKAVTWVVPDGTYSDHAGPYVTDEGPSWVSALVNAVGTGPQWNSTAIVILWDDWGGYYDPVPPPQMDFRGLGIRTPLMVVSPYTPRGKVSKTLYEPASILEFIETVFGLPPIAGSCPAPPSQGYGYTDCRANVLNEFDFGQLPRAFVPIKAKYPPSTFTNSSAAPVAPDTE